MKDVTTDNLNKSAVSENSVLTMKDVTTDNVNKSAVNENTVLLTEKPSTIAEETVKEVTTDNIINKTAVSENTIISKSLTNEFDRIVTNIENDNNYNTAIYPFHNIINATKFTNKYFLENKENLNDSIMDLKIVSYNNNNNNDSELNSIKSSSAVIIDNRTDMKEIDQSTTSMTRATNATLAPINNSTTEASVVTISSANKAEEQIMTTTSKDELLTTGFAENTDTTTDMPEIIATTVHMPEINERMDSMLQTVNMTAENLNITNLNDTDLTAEIAENLDDTDNKVINISTTNFDNYLKRTNFTKFSENPLITTEASIKMKNESILKISEPNAVLNQTNNDIKNGVESELTVPANSSTVRSNFLKTTTEKQQLTTFEITDEGTVTETYNSTDENSKQHETVSNSYDIVESTISPTILHEADDINDDDSLLMYNTTGNDTKFAIDSKLNITDHDLDDDNDESIINTDEKDFTDLIVPPAVDSDSNRTSLKDDLITTTMVTGDLIKTTTEIVPKTDTAAPPVVSSTTTTTTSTTPSSTTATVVTTTIASLDDDVVTPGDDDSTGIEMEDYDTGVIMPMNVRMFVHATYKEMCSSKDILIDAIVRFFQTIADRSINRNQIKIKNLMHECESPHPEDKGVVPVHLMITDNHGQYDKRLTDVFVLLVRQESLSFKYPITQVDKIIDHGMSLESETQGRGTIIAAIVISSIAGLCLLVLTILLVIMRKRQRGFNYGQRCTPVSLDDYSLDNISVYNSVRRKAMRASKRSYGNPAFDDPTAISNSLNFAGLAAAVNEKNKLEDEYSRIPVVTVKPDELPAGAEVKNRYANVIPLPETRVTLNTPNNNDFDQFINANFVKGTKGIEKFYIACQAPMKDTITDFWQMVWEQQSRIIIMLTDLHENGVEKCADYLPPSEVLDCHRVFGDLQVTLKKREAREKYIISSLQLKNLESNLWREVTHMWYIGWPVRGVPDDLSSIIAFLIEARSYAKNGPPPPIVVHCSPGTGRTGTIIAVDIAIRDFETNRVVDIPRTVYNVRRDRAGAVQTSQQYMFIYQVLHLYATKLTGGGLDSI
ncbi:hypothetical protein O3M35_007906 [Rhynocoris fuscipes]|uniref:protein-tyrosine-phosphatase n=1 Tax=Rhynocoris fuscipes TaxID=488301 RepID=A0AAW1DCM2_9HEMI